MDLPRKRGRKRKLKDTDHQDCSSLQQPLPARAIPLVGRYLKKLFEGRNYVGKIVSYDSGLYRVEYEDGDWEDLDSIEAVPYLLPDRAFTKTLLNKKRKLDDMISRKANKQAETAALSENMDNSITTSEKHVAEEGGSDADSACESGHDCSALQPEAELLTYTPLELPPSSGTIGVPEEYVSHLFSVYSFLRSFSIRLFLRPFGLDDFVGALNCPAKNTLLDAIHLSLLRALRRHLETMPADVSDLSSECLRCIDWGLLDTLTWPVYVLRYVMVMGYTKGKEWKGFYGNVIEREYCSLSVGMKLVILQMLCDDVLNSAELRAEVDIREEEEGEGSEIITNDHSEGLPQRVHARFSKTYACKDLSVIKITADNHASKSDSRTVDQDSNSDECRICGMDGILLCCDGCPSVYHSRCIGINKLLIPDGAWYCPECTVDKTGHTVSSFATLKSAEMFGIDSEKRVFLGTCDHFLVIKAFPDEETYVRYYNKNDIKRVMQILHSSNLYDTVYSGICKGILKYWNMSEDAFVHTEKVEKEETAPNHEGNFSDAVQRVLTVNSSIHDVASYSLSSKSSDSVQHANSLRFSVTNPFQVRASCHGGRRIGEINERKACIYTGSSFKHNNYINHYIHGEFAASAAANLSVLSSEENMFMEVQASGNVKKVMSANMLLQVKAFGSAASRFFWPNPELKFVEVPRERCGWCISCQGAVASKKACMLNAACLSAHRGAMKFLSSFRACKIEDACLASIATYILYMEDSFGSLMVGPFLSSNYRTQWRNDLGQASTCHDLKSFLLELERNIRDVAFSSDWLKLVGDSSIESWALPNSSLTPAPAPKRGRRKKKLLSSFDTAESEDKDDINWWRGGKMLKLIFQRGIMPTHILKKAARQGGRNKISGVEYTDSGIPRRSRQLIWRAAVQMCKNTSQLALQVRILDHHLRWSDLNRPDQSSHEGKGSDTEASVFRNGLICDKRIAVAKISYGVVFGNQKHLPLRIMKTVTDLEKGQDGREKHWFPEVRIPLYLIKEFEAGKTEACPQLVNRTSKTLSSLQKKQLKDARRDIFSYLACKRDNSSKCSCTACPLRVLLRDAVKCNDCQGYCHAGCTLSSNIPPNTGAGQVTTFTCKQCYFLKPVSQGNSSNSPTSSLLLLHGQGQNRSAVKGFKVTQPRSVNQPLSTAGMDKSNYGIRPSAPDFKKKKKNTISWGLIWKKKLTEDNHVFRRTNVLLRGTQYSESPKPVCALCQKPYNPELIYVRCETCKKWYHGDAVELDESKIPDLMGFKCCKCRRIRSPDCPFLDPDFRKPEVNLLHYDSNLEISGFQPLGAFKTPLDEETSPPLYFNTDEIFISSDDPLLFSLSRVEQVTEPFSDSDLGWDIKESGPKKLPVRRQVKNDNGSYYLEPVDQEVCYDNDTQLTEDVANESAQDELMFDLDSIDYEDMEFEPHTYFSMNELLADGEADADHAPVNDQGLCTTSSMSHVVTVGIQEPSNSYGQLNPELQEKQRLDIKKCDSCQSAVPALDLVCDLCGLSIHRDCSPWFENTSVADHWRCGSCREWQ